MLLMITSIFTTVANIILAKIEFLLWAKHSAEKLICIVLVLAPQWEKKKKPLTYFCFIVEEINIKKVK